MLWQIKYSTCNYAFYINIYCFEKKSYYWKFHNVELKQKSWRISQLYVLKWDVIIIFCIIIFTKEASFHYAMHTLLFNGLFKWSFFSRKINASWFFLIYSISNKLRSVQHWIWMNIMIKYSKVVCKFTFVFLGFFKSHLPYR